MRLKVDDVLCSLKTAGVQPMNGISAEIYGSVSFVSTVLLPANMQVRENSLKNS
jgi:hypothetical protein